MGAMGVRRLLERAANPDQPKVYLVLSTDLVIRKSVSPPRLG
jgi:DNA-binding LacI/PurR family transcriptional regulator